MKSVTVDMGKAELKPELIPVLLEGDKIVSRPVEFDGETYHITCVSMGNPHCVVFCDYPDLVITSYSIHYTKLYEHAHLERVTIQHLHKLDVHAIREDRSCFDHRADLFDRQ